MHLSFYFLRFLSDELKQKLVGATFMEGHYQHKEETHFLFSKGEQEEVVKFTNYSNFTCLSFPELYHPSRKATHKFCKAIEGLKVLDIVMHENDRSFHFVFKGGYQLLFKLYGSRSNIVLFQDGECIEVLNRKLIFDRDIKVSEVPSHLPQNFETFVALGMDLHKLFPALDKHCLAFLTANGYNESSDTEKWSLVGRMLALLNEKAFHIENGVEDVKMTFFSNGTESYKCDSALVAANAYEKEVSRSFYFNRLKQDLLLQLNQKVKKASLYLSKVVNRKEALAINTPYHHVGDIIMANMHAIPKGVTTVELLNFYTNKLEKINLKKDITPQKNAENFYRKGKNQKVEIEELDRNINAKKLELATLNELKIAIEIIEEFRSLKKYAKDNGLLKDEASKSTVEEALFRKFELEGFEIWVGKNAKNNDLLTQKYSHKEDLWLHARDVAGSHVLIKYKSNQKYTKSVIEKAAQLAAYYSKRKSDTLCPVIVIPKKYVRKPKRAAPGEVFLEREEVVMVVPCAFDEL